MSGNNFGDMGWSSGRSSSSRKGKRGNNSQEKPKQPQRGLGVAQLEKIRIQSEMAEYFHPLQPPLVHRTGSLNMEDASTSLPSSPSSSFHATAVSSPFPIHPNLVMAYGGAERADMRCDKFQSTPIIRSPTSHNDAIYGAPQYSHPSVTLPLFEPEESIRLKRQHDRNQSVDSSMNSDSCDPQDVDLELKL